MTYEKLIDYKGLELQKTDEADDDILALLNETVIGAEGGMQYSMQNIRAKIMAYGSGIYFFTLHRKNNLVGVIGMCRRFTTTDGRVYSSTHLRYLSVKPAFQTESAIIPRETGYHFKESFKHRVFSLFSKPYYLSEGADESGEKHVMYAYVESKNERSKNLINQAGYEYIRSFLTVAFSRFNPRKDSRVSKLAPADYPLMKEKLGEFYSNYCLYTDEFNFFNDRYYVLREGGEIVAGVSVIPTSYRVINIPGVWGWLLMKVMPKSPYLKRLFRPGEFRYLVLSAIYCSKGKEVLLPDLFDAVCAEENFNTALTWLDDHSDLYQSLRTNRRMGTLNRLLNAKPGLVYASFTNISAEEKDRFYDSPVYISGFDFS
ncbi:MAG TPA: hypothetical protein PLP69_05990 [Bacteroidales bacterium]|nr:hypothetical protein [Bacteroidales bacterium]